MDYSVICKFETDTVAKYNQEGWRICYAFGCAYSDWSEALFTVVAGTSSLAPNVTISWTEKYAMAASDAKFQDGSRVTARTSPADIAFGQRYKLSDVFSGSVGSYDRAPKTGFSFETQTKAAAVVYKIVNGQMAPIYINKQGAQPPGSEEIVPKLSIALWLSQSAASSTMISQLPTEPGPPFILDVSSLSTLPTRNAYVTLKLVPTWKVGWS